jgi:3-(3-hydroxy-phenyl)propionate hydroxylase
LSEDFLKDLMHWRTSRPHDYRDSPLNACAEADREFHGGVSCGQPLKNVRLAAYDHLFDTIGARAGFHLMLFVGDEGLTPDLREVLAAVEKMPYPIHRLIVAPAAPLGDPEALPIVGDSQGRTGSKYDASPGTVYLIRPDLHVCARWRRANPKEVVEALRRATGFAEGYPT